ncbi:MAG TPA: hypothetical protein VIS99_07320 [Terrimicrobiaceae bacterium]
MRANKASKILDGEDERVELIRSVALCHPGWTSLRCLTFAPDLRCSPTWLHWKETVFATILPAIEEARFAYTSGDSQALAGCDRAIDSVLSSKLKERSLFAGKTLMEGYSAPKSEKLWLRYTGLVASGEVPGHLAIWCAVRGASFHLSPPAILSAYLFLEARGGLPKGGMEIWMHMVADCLLTRKSDKAFRLRAA